MEHATVYIPEEEDASAELMMRGSVVVLCPTC